ncbi:hypothetical protein B0H63DRAFT_162771 [Podospora didyma]|uniref:Uncharacterized protein n=1 Tax=Podospora didyma TaxID=330526 RepID=A0AAE0U1Z5_9PEZI|nr:hypothetical protein B0H63DRAFT_162771 [Podospora didyma]
MSRALDEDVAASLKSGNPLAAYKSISETLQLSPSAGLLELEILGKTHPLPGGLFAVQDGPAVGVSKSGLVQAFLVARKQLAGHLDKSSPRTDDELFAATAVILLMDPEHLTAANTRKRLLQNINPGLDNTQPLLTREKHLVDSLLTSRLHRHTKSPTLWNHRRWLLRLFESRGLPVDVLGDITNVVLVAGERHPRNYYAWCHARFLAGLSPEVSSGEILGVVKEWCWKHHTDISGWTFLYYLLSVCGSLGEAASCSTFAEVIELVSSLRLANESIWVFLRTLAASELVGEKERVKFRSAGQDLLETLTTSTDLRVLGSALDWCETCRISD